MNRMNRRRFVQTSAAAAGFFLTAGVTESGARRQDNPMDRLNIAIIGCGGQGAGNTGNVSRENIVALCDPDQDRARVTFAKYAKVPKYDDFRVMLEKQKDIEAVVVSTPDHTHAVAACLAMSMGKHCYCEKPLTHDVWEARQMRQLAAKHHVATQMGNMGTANNNLRTAVEIIRAGAIGEVREVHVWTNRPIWPQGMTQRPKNAEPVPKTLAWDLWLSTAPERPYHHAYLPFSWRGWWDFGTGALGDMGCHTMNMPYMALELGAPSSVVAETDHPNNNESPPEGLMVTYEFPARGGKPPVTFKWYERRRPRLDLFEGLKELSGSGSLLIGSKGKLYSPSDYGGEYRLLPAANFRDYHPPKPTLPRSPGHHQEWIRACKGGAAAMSNFDYAGPLTEMVLLGNVAIRLGRQFRWDSERMRCLDMSGAHLAAGDPFIRREYRKGWTLPT